MHKLKNFKEQREKYLISFSLNFLVIERTVFKGFFFFFFKGEMRPSNERGKFEEAEKNTSQAEKKSQEKK